MRHPIYNSYVEHNGPLKGEDITYRQFTTEQNAEISQYKLRKNNILYEEPLKDLKI